MSRDENILDLEDVTVSFDGFKALNSLSLKVKKNQCSEGSQGAWGEFWEPWWPPGAPRTPYMSKNHIRGPPMGPPIWEAIFVFV